VGRPLVATRNRFAAVLARPLQRLHDRKDAAREKTRLTSGFRVERAGLVAGVGPRRAFCKLILQRWAASIIPPR
jgi:hypothetical protein